MVKMRNGTMKKIIGQKNMMMTNGGESLLVTLSCLRQTIPTKANPSLATTTLGTNPTMPIRAKVGKAPARASAVRPKAAKAKAVAK